jgi:hypothetical protein
MNHPLKPDAQLLCKLGSVVVHSEELLSPTGFPLEGIYLPKR